MFHVVVNPAGASGRTGKIWEEIEPVFKAGGKEYRVHFSTEEEGLGEICREILREEKEECDLVIVGGDGSMNRALQGIDDISRVRLGYIPGGSGNDLARDMDLPKDVKKIAETILRGEIVRTEDVGEVIFCNTAEKLDPALSQPVPFRTEGEDIRRRFLVSCGIGFDAAVCEGVDTSSLKHFLNRLHIGKLSYIAIAVKLIFTSPKLSFSLDLEEPAPLPENGGKRQKTEDFLPESGHVEKEDTIFAAVMNHQYEGGGFRFCPYADASDGMLDLCLASPKNRLVFFPVFPTAYKGNHVKYDCVNEARAKEFTIRTKEPLWVHTDGETEYTSSMIRVRTLPDKIRFLN